MRTTLPVGMPTSRSRRAVTAALATTAVLVGTIALAPAALAEPSLPDTQPVLTDSAVTAPAATPPAAATGAAPTADEIAALAAAATPAPPRLTKAQRAAAREARRAAKVKAIRAKTVAVARKQLRDSYVAGASGPNAFDCSGFTRYVWRQAAGKNLPHYSRAQYRMGHKVSIAKARPGDLVFFFGGGAHHVGLYIGNHKMIHAANPRSDVLVSDIRGPWYGPRFSGIRSIIKD